MGNSTLQDYNKILQIHQKQMNKSGSKSYMDWEKLEEL